MTNEEALRILHPDTTRSALETYDSPEFACAQACLVACKAIEKQIPIKVNYEFDGYYDGVPVYDIAECPCCGHKFYDGEHDWEMDVCPKCHQALDWTE